MSTENLKLNKMYFKNSYKRISDKDFNISELVIPFSKIFSSQKSIDVYSGKEKIPFKERDPEYKMILREEFDNNLNCEFKIFKPVVRFPSF